MAMLRQILMKADAVGVALAEIHPHAITGTQSGFVSATIDRLRKQVNEIRTDLAERVIDQEQEIDE